MFIFFVSSPGGPLIDNSKSENDDLKRDLEASKPPSTGVSGLSVPLFVILVLLIIFQPEGFSESFNASVQLARTNTTQRYVCIAMFLEQITNPSQ